jgi:hypothetical protein
MSVPDDPDLAHLFELLRMLPGPGTRSHTSVPLKVWVRA